MQLVYVVFFKMHCKEEKNNYNSLKTFESWKKMCDIVIWKLIELVFYTTCLAFRQY